MEGITEFFGWILIGLVFLVAFVVGGIIVNLMKRWMVYLLIGGAYVALFGSISLKPEDYSGFIGFLVKTLDVIAIPYFVLSGCCILFLVLAKKKGET